VRLLSRIFCCAFHVYTVPGVNMDTDLLPSSHDTHPTDIPGLDQLSHWLRNDEYFGYATLFCLIFITTFRTSFFLSLSLMRSSTGNSLCLFFSSSFYLPGNYLTRSSTRPSLLHTDHTLWIYLWSVDWCIHLILGSFIRRYRRLLLITYIPP